MTPEIAVDLFREALWLTALFVSVIVMPSLIVGLLVAMFQAATQINEQTLSFLAAPAGDSADPDRYRTLADPRAYRLYAEPDPEHPAADRLTCWP